MSWVSLQSQRFSSLHSNSPSSSIRWFQMGCLPRCLGLPRGHQVPGSMTRLLRLGLGFGNLGVRTVVQAPQPLRQNQPPRVDRKVEKPETISLTGQ